MRRSSDDHAFSLEDEMKIGVAGSETLWRFKQLVLFGYKPNYEFSNEEAFWFDHPRLSFKHRSVALYPSGVVRSMLGGDESTFERWDKEGFKDFLADVPVPNWWDRTREARYSLFGLLMVAVALGLIMLVSSALRGN
jgi:hypothetical protein